MKSEPFQFSPTSAGVRIDHLNLQHSNKKASCDNKTSCFLNTTKNNTNCNKTTFSLPRPRATPSASSSSYATTIPDEKGHFLEPNHIIIHNPCIDPTTIKTGKSSFTPQRGAKKSSNKMRNCLAIVGVTVILGLLSFVLLVECRSVKGHPKKQYDAEISSESRIQDDSFQEPDPESSEEHPTKVVATTFSSKDASSSSSASSAPTFPAKSSSSTTKRTTGTSPTSASRLTRSRVSVICKGGHSGVLEEDLSSTTSTSSSSTTKKSHKKHDSINLPTFLPRETDDAEEDEDQEGEERDEWDDEDNDGTLSSEESQGQVITVTGYSQVSGRKPQTKSLVKSASNTAIKYVPKPNKGKSDDSDDDNDSSSSEEVAEVATTAKPKAHASSGSNKHRGSKLQKASHKNHAEPTALAKTSEESSTTQNKVSSGDKKHKHSHRHSKRESAEEEEDEDVTTTTARPPKRSSKHSSKKSSKHSGSNHSKNSSVTANSENKNEKGDSGETEEESLFPTFRNAKSDGKRARKAERKQKAAPLVPVATAVDSDLESAEAEPEAVISNLRKTDGSTSSSSSRRSSRSKKSKSSTSDINDSKKEAPSVKPVIAEESSSEELNMEEMPYTTHESNSKKSKSRRSSSSSSSKNSRMNSRTAAPKQRTGTFSSVEIDD